VDLWRSSGVGGQHLKQSNQGNSHQAKTHASSGNGGEGKDRHLHNPIEDRLVPLEPLDLAKVHSIDDLEPILDLFTPHGRTTTSIVHSAPVPPRPLPVP